MAKPGEAVGMAMPAAWVPPAELAARSATAHWVALPTRVAQCCGPWAPCPSLSWAKRSTGQPGSGHRPPGTVPALGGMYPPAATGTKVPSLLPDGWHGAGGDAGGAPTLAEPPAGLQPHCPGTRGAAGPLNPDWGHAFKKGGGAGASRPAGGGCPGAGGLSELVLPPTSPPTPTPLPHPHLGTFTAPVARLLAGWLCPCSGF